MNCLPGTWGCSGFLPSGWVVGGIVRFFCDAVWDIFEKLWKEMPGVNQEFNCDYSLIKLCSCAVN